MIPETRLTVEESEAALAAAGIDIDADWSAATFDRAMAALEAATSGKANGGNRQ